MKQHDGLVAAARGPPRTRDLLRGAWHGLLCVLGRPLAPVEHPALSYYFHDVHVTRSYCPDKVHPRPSILKSRSCCMSMSQSRAVAVSQRSPVDCACWCSSCMCQACRPGGTGLTACTVMHANAGARLSRAEIERWGPCLLSHARVALESRTASSSFVARVALYSGVCCLFPRSLRYVVVCQCNASQGAVG